jgi:NAD(P)-dependent dehydrogenase (short-subunit alcohol dehydrogenase family)
MSEATFTGRSLLVTGATGETGEIGQAIATEFGRRGGHVLAAGRDPEQGETVAGQIRSHGARADFIPADLRDAASVKDPARRATEVTGRVDILVNDAGIAVFGPTGAASEQDFDAVDGVEEANGVLGDAST